MPRCEYVKPDGERCRCYKQAGYTYCNIHVKKILHPTVTAPFGWLQPSVESARICSLDEERIHCNRKRELEELIKQKMAMKEQKRRRLQEIKRLEEILKEVENSPQ
jgi:hypothetical protein